MDISMYSPEEIRNYHVRAIMALVQSKLDVHEVNEVEYHFSKFSEMNVL